MPINTRLHIPCRTVYNSEFLGTAFYITYLNVLKISRMKNLVIIANVLAVMVRIKQRIKL